VCGVPQYYLENSGRWVSIRENFKPFAPFAWLPELELIQLAACSVLLENVRGSQGDENFLAKKKE
jgi:hypothetical protein